MLVVTDEVYEHLTFDGAARADGHAARACAERTLTISSAGKTFSCTGWKVGWVSGPAAAVAAVRTVKQFLTFSVGAPFQPAVGDGAGPADATFTEPARPAVGASATCSSLRLGAAGFAVAVPAGTYFVVADAAPLGVSDDGAFCRELPERVRRGGDPGRRSFYDDPAGGADAAPVRLLQAGRGAPRGRGEVDPTGADVLSGNRTNPARPKDRQTCHQPNRSRLPTDRPARARFGAAITSVLLALAIVLGPPSAAGCCSSRRWPSPPAPCWGSATSPGLDLPQGRPAAAGTAGRARGLPPALRPDRRPRLRPRRSPWLGPEPPVLFYIAVGFALVAALLNAVFDFCLGCEIYLLSKRVFGKATPAAAG